MPEPTDVLSTDSSTAARNSAEEVNGRSSSSSDQSKMDSWLLELLQYLLLLPHSHQLIVVLSIVRSSPVVGFPIHPSMLLL